MKEKHTFALWYPDLIKLFFKNDDDAPMRERVALTDEQLCHRIEHVLRLVPGDELIIFDEKLNVRSIIDSIDRKSVIVRPLEIASQRRTGIALTVVLPLLKKDDYDAALYSLAALGVATIQLVITEKTQRAWQGAVDYERSLRIIRAAAEQSKYFAMPILKEPLSLRTHLPCLSPQTTFVADPQGMPLRDLMLKTARLDEATLLVGPEGGFTPFEVALIEEYGIRSYRLTPTVLKAEQAASLMAGIFRSVFY